MSLKYLQEKIGVTADNLFGPGTMKAAIAFYKLTPIRAAHFFAQTAHETGEFKLFTENLNYSAKGLQKTFGKYFPGNLEDLYARNPEKIASRVYASRMGNGDEASKDGWKFRGRGALQLTGRSNYEAFAKYLNNPEIIENPDLVTTTYAFESAMYFFEKNKLWNICDKGVDNTTITSLTKRINGGTNGLNHRIALTTKYYNYVK
jgi:putative chitinase